LRERKGDILTDCVYECLCGKKFNSRNDYCIHMVNVHKEEIEQSPALRAWRQIEFFKSLQDTIKEEELAANEN